MDSQGRRLWTVPIRAVIFLIASACGSAAAQCSNATVVGTYRYLWAGYGSFGTGGE
jgi:hypothetical protein